MEAICSASPSPSPSPPSLSSHQTLTRSNRRSTGLVLNKSQKQTHQLFWQHGTRTQALRSVLIASTNSQPRGADISVLVQISALLLFIYWITNFVVPGMIIKDFEASSTVAEEAQEEEEEEEEEEEQGGGEEYTIGKRKKSKVMY